MSKYKKLFNEMVEKNSNLFTKFRNLHNEIENGNEKYRNDFNSVGEIVNETIRLYVDELCRTSESSGYGNYTSKLADKFYQVVREEFNLIDDVGVS